MYFGAGVRPCDSGAEINQVKSVFDSIAMFKDAGIEAVALTDVFQRSAFNGSRSCTATIVTSADPQRSVTYEIDQRGGVFYTQWKFAPLQ